MAGSISRTLMTMRAVVQRDANAGTFNAYGEPDIPDWQAHTTLPCRMWSKRRMHEADRDKDALVEDLRIMFPLDSDVTEADRIDKVTDRLEATLWAGPLELRAGQPKHDHVEYSIRRVS